MAGSSKSGDLGPAIDLIAQPLVLEALVAIDDGKALEDALSSDVDSIALTSAVQRLAAIGAIQLAATGVLGRHTLTARGTELMGLLRELDALVAADDVAICDR
jgi:hypothetical protein